MSLTLEISSDEAVLILVAVQGYSEFFSDKVSVDQSVQFQLTAESIVAKLKSGDLRFSKSECSLIFESLSSFEYVANKSKAIAKKGSKLYKKTHSDLKIVGRLIALFSE